MSGVGKRYGRGAWVLRDVDVTIAEGDVVVVTGLNGAGKSTLLRMAAGASRPSSGRLERGPTTVRYAPDRPAALDRMSTQEYLVLQGQIQGLSAAASRTRVGEILERLSFVGTTSRPIRELSKGNAQKVNLVQALLTPAGLLVLDEPGAALDASARDALSGLVVESAQRGGAVMLSDHVSSIAASVGTRRLTVSSGGVHDAQALTSAGLATIVLTSQHRATTPAAEAEHIDITRPPACGRFITRATGCICASTARRSTP